MRELDGQALMTRSLISAISMSVINNPRDRVAVFKESIEYMTKGLMSMKLESLESIERTMPRPEEHRDFKELAAAFNVLKQTNLYDTLRKALE